MEGYIEPRYLKVSNSYLVNLENIHTIVNEPIPPSPHPVVSKLTDQIVITYLNGVNVFLVFTKKEDAESAFQKIADSLGAL